MYIIISHQSALEYWRLHGGDKLDHLKKQHRKSLPTSFPKIADMRETIPSGLSYPINLMFASSKDRRKSSVVQPHVYCGPISDLCFLKMEEGISISSPAFCFFQMAGELSLIKLIELGYELCGSYSLPATKGNSIPSTKGNSITATKGNSIPATIGKNLSRGVEDKNIYGHPQLTNTKELLMCASRLKGISGHVNVSRALRYIVDGSASPMETILVMLLTLPYKLGGYGLPPPELNKKIEFGKSAAHRYGKAFYVCDLFWPKDNLAIEYDSALYHTGAERINNDSKKRMDLAILGIDVITVTNKQIQRRDMFDDLSKLIAGKLQKRLRYENDKFRKAQRELHSLLLN